MIMLLVIAALLIVFSSPVERLVIRMADEGLQTIVGMGIGVLMIWVIYFILSFLIPDWVYSLGFAIIIASYLYFTYIFPYVTHLVPDDKTWVVAHKIKQESSAIRNTFSGYREIVAQRECPAGLHWTWFWEVATKEVDMTRNITISSPPNDVYQLRDGNVVLVRWRVIYTPLPGNIKNYIRSRPDLIKTQISDRVTSWLQGKLGQLNKDEVKYGEEGQKQLKKDFEFVFGGPNEIDDEIERPAGVWTSTVVIISIEQLGAVQELNSFFETVEKAIENSKKNNPSSPLTYEQAQDLVIANRARGLDIDLVKLGRTK